MLNLGYHLVNMLTWMFGDLEVEYSVLNHRYALPVEDAATVVLKSKNSDTRCVVNVGWYSKLIFPNFNFRVNINGTVGYTSTNHFAPNNLFMRV